MPEHPSNAGKNANPVELKNRVLGGDTQFNSSEFNKKMFYSCEQQGMEFENETANRNGVEKKMNVSDESCWTLVVFVAVLPVQ